jgi:hypothetical protein
MVIAGRLDYVGVYSFVVIDSATGTITQVPYRNLTQLQAWSPGPKTTIIVVTVIAAVLVYLLVVVKEF